MIKYSKYKCIKLKYLYSFFFFFFSFNRIDLPPYTSYTQLKQKLLRAIAEGINDFDRE